jgi:hypothetical protein
VGRAPRPDSSLRGSRDLESIEAAQRRAASPHSGCTAARAGYQQNKARGRF